MSDDEVKAKIIPILIQRRDTGKWPEPGVRESKTIMDRILDMLYGWDSSGALNWADLDVNKLYDVAASKYIGGIGMQSFKLHKEGFGNQLEGLVYRKMYEATKASARKVAITDVTDTMFKSDLIGVLRNHPDELTYKLNGTTMEVTFTTMNPSKKMDILDELENKCRGKCDMLVESLKEGLCQKCIDSAETSGDVGYNQDKKYDPKSSLKSGEECDRCGKKAESVASDISDLNKKVDQMIAKDAEVHDKIDAGALDKKEGMGKCPGHEPGTGKPCPRKADSDCSNCNGPLCSGLNCVCPCMSKKKEKMESKEANPSKKIGCIGCDEITTVDAWAKAGDRCPKCGSAHGVAESLTEASSKWNTDGPAEVRKYLKDIESELSKPKPSGAKVAELADNVKYYARNYMESKKAPSPDLQKYFDWIYANVTQKGLAAGDKITADALLREFPDIERPPENPRWYASQIVNLYNKARSENFAEKMSKESQSDLMAEAKALVAAVSEGNEARAYRIAETITYLLKNPHESIFKVPTGEKPLTTQERAIATRFGMTEKMPAYKERSIPAFKKGQLLGIVAEALENYVEGKNTYAIKVGNTKVMCDATDIEDAR